MKKWIVEWIFNWCERDGGFKIEIRKGRDDHGLDVRKEGKRGVKRQVRFKEGKKEGNSK